jgi:phage terminase large subunit-like protein
MGQHGRGAAVRTEARDYVARRGAQVFAWENKKLSRVEKVIAFIEELPITKGILRGEKMRLLPRQRQFVVDLYSSRDGSDRNYNLAIKSEPKGNGKTGLLSALALCHLLGPEAEDRGEVFSAAIDREQASLLFAEMVAILREIPDYMECVNIVQNRKKIEVIKRFKGYPGKGSTYAALSQDARSAHGLAPSVWIYDELAQAKTRELLDNLINGMGKRDDALGIVISTQAPSDDHPLSMLIDEGRSGQNPNIYVMLDAAPDDADPFDPEVWKTCNPALGIFLNEKEFAIAADRAKRNSAYEASFRNLRLNQRISPDLDRLIAASDWKKLQAPIDLERLKGRECIGALDLSKTTDLSSLVLVFPDDAKETGYDIVPFFWTPQGNLDTRLQAERERLTEWIRRGYIEATPGPVIRYDFIARKIQELQARYKIKAIAYDNWHFQDLQIELTSIGLTNLPVEPFTQGHSKAMAPAVKFFQECALTGRLRHDGNAMLTASVVNAVVILDRAGNPMLDKSKSHGPVRIDGAVALVMALGTARRYVGEPVREFKLFYV